MFIEKGSLLEQKGDTDDTGACWDKDMIEDVIELQADVY